MIDMCCFTCIDVILNASLKNLSSHHFYVVCLMNSTVNAVHCFEIEQFSI